MEFLIRGGENYENHENLIIPIQSPETYEIIRIQCQNNENHKQ